MTILSLSFGLSGLLFSHLIQRERLALIDRKLTHAGQTFRSIFKDRHLDDLRIQMFARDMRQDGVLWILNTRNETFRSENPITGLLNEHCINMGFSEFDQDDRFVRCLKSDSPHGTLTMATLALPGREPFYKSENLIRYLMLFGLCGAAVAILMVRYFMWPIRRLNEKVQFLTGHHSDRDFDLIAKRLSLELKRSPKLPPDEFDRLLLSFMRFVRRMKYLSQHQKTHFSALVHELLTPLTVIQNQVSKLQDSPSPQSRQLEIISVQLSNLCQFIRDYSDWSESEVTIGRGSKAMAIDIPQKVKEIASSLEPISGNRVQILETDEPPHTLIANPHDFEQLVRNLVVNAIAHTSEGSPVRIRLQNKSIAIDDSGNGLPKEVEARIGLPFNRGNLPVNAGLVSTGMGLAIAISIAERNHWTIKFEKANTGHSTTVSLT